MEILRRTEKQSVHIPCRGGSPDPSGHALDLVEEACEESFPASDPPSFSPIIAIGMPCDDRPS